ncbi:MAG: primosomal protein N' [Bacteroidales bacterium]|nr:primosomal protein N' [Bacteroidales bacterium]
MAERTTLFVDVLLPLHLPDTYTYRVPFDYNDSICVGQRVVVQFGNKRLYSAVVRRIHTTAPAHTTKYILAILDLTPIVSELQLKFWEWIATYYMCYTGDVMAVALPASLRLSSESYLSINPDYNGELSQLQPSERLVVDALSTQQNITLNEVSDIVGYMKIMPLIKTMIEKGIIVMDEELRNRYTPKRVRTLRLNPTYLEPDAMRALFEKLESRQATHKQLSALMSFMQLSHFGQTPVHKKLLTSTDKLSPSAITALIKKEILIEEAESQSRLASPEASASPDDIALSEAQQQAFAALSTSLQETSPTISLLHGVTSSGKTEIYIKLAQQVIARGQQVLFLLPEIALTTQIIDRLRKYFGAAVGVYHSRFNSNERAEVWLRTQTEDDSKRFSLVVGARSALFLPFHNLGLIIVDEEHDPSYKQNEPAPRYQGKDCATYLAQLWHAHTILGSATPSIESYYNTTIGKYRLVTLTQRYGGMQLPEVLCADMRDTHDSPQAQLNLSPMLMDSMQEALEHHEQIILFQNRRGFSLRIECNHCHWTPQCKNCDVSLVYHKSTNSLRCHYCGYTASLPNECPACHSTSLSMKGFGTERVEDDLSILFPQARIARLDLDSTQRKNRHEELINDFADHRIDILVGTQMVTKGLDFDNVSVVGILSADNLLSYPDFRAYERSFQLMTQVSGRAGRHGRRGKVIIQTYNPWHQAIRDAMECNYNSMYDGQLNERRVFRYPPFYKIVDIIVKHKEPQVLNEAAAHFAQLLRQELGDRVLGPEYPVVQRVRTYYQKKVMVRFAVGEPIGRGKQWMMHVADEMMSHKGWSGLRIVFNVDPQ